MGVSRAWVVWDVSTDWVFLGVSVDRRLWVLQWPWRYGMFQLRCFSGPTVISVSKASKVWVVSTDWVFEVFQWTDGYGCLNGLGGMGCFN